MCNDPSWGHIALSALEHPNVIEGRQVLPTKVSRAWVEQIAALYGTDSAEYQRQVLGEFSDDSVAVLVDADALEKTYALHDVGRLRRAGEPLRIGVDPSMGGSDRFAVCVADGGHVAELAAWVEPDTMRSVGRLVEVLRRHDVAREGRNGREAVILIDCAFGGKVIFDLLRQEGWPVEAWWSNGAPTISEDLRIAAKYDPSLWDEVEPWANARAQAYCVLAKLIREGKAALPRDPALAEELLIMHKLLTPKGALQIESKGELRARLGRSPDLADAVAMALGTTDPTVGLCTIGGSADITF
jgi:hypothetical protein